MGGPSNPNLNKNPYWSRAIQYQQRNQQQEKVQQPVRQQTQQQGGRQRHRIRDDFGDEWVGREVESEVAKGANIVVLRGRIVEVAKYWIKVIVDGGVVYVNKAAIVSIKPHQ